MLSLIARFLRFIISPSAQRLWIRKHPVQYVVINVVPFAAWLGYIEYKDRKEMKEWSAEYDAAHAQPTN